MNSLFVSPVNSLVLMSLILAGPFVIILILAISLRRAEAIPGWILGILIACGLLDLWFVWVVWPPQLPPRASVLYPFYVLWWIVAAGALVSFPLVVFREGRKRVVGFANRRTTARTPQETQKLMTQIPE